MTNIFLAQMTETSAAIKISQFRKFRISKFRISHFAFRNSLRNNSDGQLAYARHNALDQAAKEAFSG